MTTSHPVDSTTRPCCGGIGTHTRDCPPTMQDYQLGDTHRRIRNVLNVAPAQSWTVDESQQVLAALAGIVRARQEATR